MPLNFGYEISDGEISFYIHGAKLGRKIELMRKNGVCSFEMDCAHKLEFVYESKDAAMRYKSLMGTAKIEIPDGGEKQHGIDVLMGRYPETRDFEYNRGEVPHTMVARLTVLEYSGKINPAGGGAD